MLLQHYVERNTLAAPLKHNRNAVDTFADWIKFKSELCSTRSPAHVEPAAEPNTSPFVPRCSRHNHRRCIALSRAAWHDSVGVLSMSAVNVGAWSGCPYTAADKRTAVHRPLLPWHDDVCVRAHTYICTACWGYLSAGSAALC